MASLAKDNISQPLSVDANNKCAECESEAVEFVSLDLGIFLCPECSTRHRQVLNSPISKVQSLSSSTIEILATKGNARGKEIFEARVPLYVIRPPLDIGALVIDDWIRAKYEQRKYVDAHKRNTITQDMKIGSNENEQVSAELNFAVHKLPCAPLQSMVDCILPNGIKSQFIVLHARWIARYAAPSSTKCEQIIDISMQPVWITEASTERCVLQIGISIHQRMRLQFEKYAHIKVWTESIRRAAIFYHTDGLGYNLSAIRTTDIEPMLPCTVSDLHNESVVKHLKYGWIKKSNSIFGWDKKWWCIHLKKKTLLYFAKDPRTLKIKGTFVDAQGGFYLNELVADTDNNGYRSSQKNCLLLYHFGRTLWLRFDDNLSLLSFWKELHVTPHDVKFIGDRASYYEKAVVQQNEDIQIMAFKAGQTDVMSPYQSPLSAAASGFGSFFDDKMGDFNLNDSSSHPASPKQPQYPRIPSEFMKMAETMNIDTNELDSAILNHELLDMQTRMSIAMRSSITADVSPYANNPARNSLVNNINPIIYSNARNKKMHTASGGGGAGGGGGGLLSHFLTQNDDDGGSLREEDEDGVEQHFVNDENLSSDEEEDDMAKDVNNNRGDDIERIMNGFGPRFGSVASADSFRDDFGFADNMDRSRYSVWQEQKQEQPQTDGNKTSSLATVTEEDGGVEEDKNAETETENEKHGGNDEQKQNESTAVDTAATKLDVEELTTSPNMMSWKFSSKSEVFTSPLQIGTRLSFNQSTTSMPGKTAVKLAQSMSTASTAPELSGDEESDRELSADSSMDLDVGGGAEVEPNIARITTTDWQFLHSKGAPDYANDMMSSPSMDAEPNMNGNAHGQHSIEPLDLHKDHTVLNDVSEDQNKPTSTKKRKKIGALFRSLSIKKKKEKN